MPFRRSHDTQRHAWILRKAPKVTQCQVILFKQASDEPAGWLKLLLRHAPTLPGSHQSDLHLASGIRHAVGVAGIAAVSSRNYFPSCSDELLKRPIRPVFLCYTVCEQFILTLCGVIRSVCQHSVM